MDPTKAADSLDAVGDDVISALLWVDSEERGLRSVSHKRASAALRTCTGLPLRFFAGSVARTVAFVDSFVKRERGREGERREGERGRGREGEREGERGRRGEKERGRA